MLKRNEPRFVPWFSMSEWQRVYTDLFSGDATAQRKGLARIHLWRARCPEGLSTGPLCTADLIEVYLQDKEKWLQIRSGQLDDLHNLQKMYNMAILRFVNHITKVWRTKDDSTIYEIARKLHIPDWIVNIRHEAAHGHNLPSLNILREAAEFCLSWIHEEYWKREAKLIEDWVVDKSPVGSNLKDILENWQAVMLYSQEGITLYEEIPDENLQKHLLNLRMKCSKAHLKLMKKKLKAQGHVIEKNEIAEALLLIIKELNEYIETTVDPSNVYESLVDVLLEGDGFLASPDFISMFSSDYDVWRLQNDHLPIHFIEMWSTMLGFLDQNTVIPLLFRKLISIQKLETESSHRCKMAALWIKELALGFRKVLLIEKLSGPCKPIIQGIQKSFPRMKIKIRPRNKISDSHIYGQILKQVEKSDPSLKEVMTLKMQKLPNNLRLQKLLDEATLKPSRWTKVFLPNLMDIIKPSLSAEIKQKILILVDIYTQSAELNAEVYGSLDDAPIYTVDDLRTSEDDEFVEGEETYVDDSMDFEDHIAEVEIQNDCLAGSDWFHSAINIDWKSCPLGRLPWQQIDAMLDLDLRSNIQWHPSEDLSTDASPKVVTSDFRHMTIDCDGIQHIWSPRKTMQVEPETPLISDVYTVIE